MVVKILQNLLEKYREFLSDKLSIKHAAEELPPLTMWEDEPFEDIFHDMEFGDK